MIRRATIATLLAVAVVGCNYFEPRGPRSVRRETDEPQAPPPAPREATRIRVPPESHPLEALGLSREEIREQGLEDLERGDYAVSVGETFIYPVQWLRAESVAETLRPLLESQYGPNVRVIPHPDTNQLLIYVPPYSEWTRGAPGTSGALPPTR